MKLITILTFLFFISNNILSQDLTFKSKRSVRIIMKKMIKDDQKYRAKIDPHQKNDSLWKLQNNLDSINKNEFISIIHKYGYPSAKRINSGDYSLVIILHFTNPEDFNQFSPIFYSELKKGNMPPIEYAYWYDRCQKNKGLPIYFGQYTNEKFYGEQQNIYNIHRKEMGLEPLK